MILFILLAIIAVAFLVSLVATVIAGGASAILIFGDAIVCVALIVIIIKAIRNKKRK